MTFLARSIPVFLASTVAATGSASAGLPATLDGSWYNPMQSGHGLTIERIDHDSALLFWHVFDPAGRPLTLYVETHIEGDVMKGEALAPNGMRFGRFEESELALPFWGRVELRFRDCTHATLTYDSPLLGYGRGDMPLTRLLRSDADCSLQAPAGLSDKAGRFVSGSLQGRYRQTSALQEYARLGFSGQLKGFVTQDGGLTLLGDNYFNEGTPYDFVVLAQPRPSAAGEAKLYAQVWSNSWLNGLLGASAEYEGPSGRGDNFDLTLKTAGQHARGLLFPEAPATGSPEGELAVAPQAQGEGALRPGVYPFEMVTTQVRATFQLEVADDLALCVRATSGPAIGAPNLRGCAYSGRATNGPVHFDFSLMPSATTAGPAIRGSGQAHDCGPHPQPGCTTLRMAGSDGYHGMALRILAPTTE